MKKKTSTTQPLTHQFSRTFLHGFTGVILASALGFGMFGMTGCVTQANAVDEKQAAAALEQDSEKTTSESQASNDKASKVQAPEESVSKDETSNDQASEDQATFETIAADFDVAALDLEYSKRDTDPSYDAVSATTISLSGTSAEVSGDGAAAADGTVTISAEGTYVLSGTFEGSVVVDAPDTDKVQLVLDGATVSNNAGAALFVKQADKCFITLAEGSENVLEDGADYTFEEGEDEPNAALFSKEDLTINGSGKLTVKGAYRHAIASKDDLVITGGEFDITAVEEALRGKDCVKIQDGTFTINAGEDGIKSNNDSDATRGFVSIDGGTFAITAGDEGIQAKTYLRIAGGDFIINAEDDALHSDLEGVIEDGALVITAGDDAFHAETILTLNGGDVAIRDCVEGYEAEKIYVNDGVHYIVASDDAVNAAVADLSDDDTADQPAEFAFGGGRAPQGQKGEFDPGARSERSNRAGEDFGATDGSADAAVDNTAEGDTTTQERRGKNRDRFQNAEEGSTAGQSRDGAESDRPEPPTINDEAMPERTTATDNAAPQREAVPGEENAAPEPPAGDPFGGERPEGDFAMEPPAGVPQGPGAPGENAGTMDGMRGGGRGGFGGPGGMAGSSTECLLQINGGYLWVDAQGDGLDSNGYIEVNGGTVLVNGPSNDGNGALDYEFGADITGGNVLVVGSAGMAEDFSETSTQPFVAAAASGQAGDTVALVDADGKVLISLTATKSFQIVQASSESLVEGQTYSIVVGGTIEGSDEVGFADSGTVEGGTSMSVTASTTPSGIARGMMGGRGGRF